MTRKAPLPLPNFYKVEGAPKVLIYDIETTLLETYLFRLGKQVVRHSQLIPSGSRWGIICINYLWMHEGIVKSIVWDATRGFKAIIEDFDLIISESDIAIGKNSDRFDNKMINALRMFEGIEGNPGWIKYTDDLEKQMRRYFKLPSQSLDYISSQMGLGGKTRMEFTHWTSIAAYMDIKLLNSKGLTGSKALNVLCQHRYHMSYIDVLLQGQQALDEMVAYGCKDVEDTTLLWAKLSEHFDPKFNCAKFKGEKHGCKHCGSTNVRFCSSAIDGATIRYDRISGKTKYRELRCRDCKRYAGRVPVSEKGELGRVG